MNKLHIGSGRSRIDGFVNVDLVDIADLRLDLDNERLPFADNSVDTVFSFHAMEHFRNYLFVLGEIWRVMNHGGMFLLQVPYVTLTEYNLVNPYHRNHFNEFSFHFFDPTKLKGSANEDNPILFKAAWHRFHYLPEFQSTPEPEITYARRHYFNVVRAIDFGLIAIKADRTMPDISDETFERESNEYANAAANSRK
jgi:SAM-dependent methyltransferase